MNEKVRIDTQRVKDLILIGGIVILICRFWLEDD